MDNKILRDLTYGVYVVGSLDGDRKVGCIANSVMQITSNPASIAISINHDNYTNEIIKNDADILAYNINVENDYTTFNIKEDEKEYLVVLPVDETEGGVLILEIKQEDGEEVYDTVTDDEEAEKVFNKFQEEYGEDDEEAEDEE